MDKVQLITEAVAIGVVTATVAVVLFGKPKGGTRTGNVDQGIDAGGPD